MSSNKNLPSSSDMSSAEPQSEVPKLPRPPPRLDGSWLAWAQCAGSFCMFFNSWGVVNSFGAFQEFYQTQYLPGEPASRISWIGSTSACGLQLFSILMGPLLDLGHLRLLLVAGTIFTVLGMMMTSIATKYWQLLLAQGICASIGNSCLFMASVGVLPAYFKDKRAMAMGIAASGSSIGAIIYSTMLHQLIPTVGFGWATRSIGFVMLATQALPLAIMRQRIVTAKARHILDASAFRDPVFNLFCLSLFFAFLGIYVPFFYVQIQTLQQGLVKGSLNFYLLALLNAGSFFGRLLPNYVADTTGPMTTLVPCTLVAAVLGFAWAAVRTPAGIVIFCLLFGFFSGSYVSLAPAITAIISPSLAVFGTRTGMVAVPIAAGLLVGNPIAGAIASKGYLGLQMFCGACTLAAAASLLAARLTFAGTTLTKKA